MPTATTGRRRRKQKRAVPISGATDDAALWYKDAVIYQLHARAFCDSNGDGVGDFRGLTQKLDYLHDLGVTAIWLLPFYPSPLKDDGYDIADYTSIHPDYGTLRDFKKFLREAHRRDLKVITELVMNHTSDEHDWFKRSRRAKPGSKWRDFYVWSDDPHLYKDTRIIFRDFESSNWSWDDTAGAYYWHRFYSHQPDLNFDNPEVRKAMFQVLDFWMDMGVDGFRLDAVPYLFEREGTTCENLQETHGFLRELRSHVDEHYPNTLLLAEANQWPEDAAAYFGEGDECHMNFHFPLMPRLFMAIQREDRFPILDILQQTPNIPEVAQWAIFLRNHDELTLEMVTDEERDYMYRTYAEDTQARINLGIRRRLAPLLKNDRRKIELMNGLLFSLPGTPVVYYGDELGMGDNIYLGDRDGVRTPMHWSADRNAGFSPGSPHRLYLPIITESEYHYEAKNVETEQNSPHSLLWWMRRIINLRKQSQVFGRGSFEFLTPENSKVLAFVREYEGESILVVANLSRFVQHVELDLSKYRGRVPVEMFGQTRLPPIGELYYLLTLGPYAFYWLRLESGDGRGMVITPEELPVHRLKEDWTEILEGRARGKLENALPRYMRKHRWFGGKARTVQSASLRDAVRLPSGTDGADIHLALLHVEYSDGEPEDYLLPLCFASGYEAERVLADQGANAIMRLEFKSGDEGGLLFEAIRQEPFWNTLLDAVKRRRKFSGKHGELANLQTRALRHIQQNGQPAAPTIHGGEQSNTSAIFGDRFIFKLFRRVSPGINPDYEIGRYLTEKSSLEHVPQVAGAVEYRRGRQEPITLAILHQFQPNEGDAWEYTLDELGRYYERVSTTAEDERPTARDLPSAGLLDLAGQDYPEYALRLIDPYLQSAELLGRRTAELHIALAAETEDEAFQPEPCSVFYQRGLYQSMRAQSKQVFTLLRKQVDNLAEPLQETARQVLGLESEVLDRFKALTVGKLSGLRTRVHGDYHLGQVLWTGKDFVIIDFEGEPSRPLSERRIKVSPLRDVGGMVRSLHYASNAALLGQAPGVVIPEDAREEAEVWMQLWYRWSTAAFLKAYLAKASESNVLPETREETSTLLNAFMLYKLTYELSYELNNRPAWARIPLNGILQLSHADA